MGKIQDFLTEAGVFFLATTDGTKPHLRPLGAHMEADGYVWFGVGDFKDVYHQMVANPYVELVAAKADGNWLRYSGKAVFDTDGKYGRMMLDGAPHLKRIYNEETGHKMMAFHIEEARAVVIPVMGQGESIL